MINALKLPAWIQALRGPRPASNALTQDADAPESFRLTRRFLLLSVAVIGLVSVASSVVLSRFIVSEGLNRDARVSAQFIEKSVLQRHAASYFQAPFEPTAERAEVERFLNDLLWMPDVLRAQLYSAGGEVLWSSHAPAVHQTYGANPELEHALAGELVVEADFLKWTAQAKAEHVFLAKVKPQFAEYYIPVWNADRTRVIGAVELYKSPESLFASIRDGIRLVWLCDALGGLAILVSLFWVVRRGQRIIARQQRRLAASEGFVAVGEVAAAVAHNLRNPLGAIRTSAELLAIDAQGGQPSADLCRYAGDIMADVDRLEQWVRGLLAYASAGAREASPLELNGFLRTLAATLGEEIAPRKVMVGASLSGEPLRAKVDPLLLEQVLRTLADNAVDAMPGGGRLAFATRQDGPWAVMALEDTGIGMPPDQVSQLFRRPASTKSRGLGVGLPLVARSVERIGGRIRVHSERGRGTRVEVALPLVTGGSE